MCQRLTPKPQHLTLWKEAKPKMSILSHYHGYSDTKESPQSHRGLCWARLRPVLIPRALPWARAAAAPSHPGRNSWCLEELEEEQVSPCALGCSTLEPGTFPSLGYWVAMCNQKCVFCFLSVETSWGGVFFITCITHSLWLQKGGGGCHLLMGSC